MSILANRGIVIIKFLKNICCIVHNLAYIYCNNICLFTCMQLFFLNISVKGNLASFHEIPGIPAGDLHTAHGCEALYCWSMRLICSIQSSALSNAVDRLRSAARVQAQRIRRLAHQRVWSRPTPRMFQSDWCDDTKFHYRLTLNSEIVKWTVSSDYGIVNSCILLQ